MKKYTTKLTIEQLIYLAKDKKGFKKLLLDFLNGK